MTKKRSQFPLQSLLKLRIQKVNLLKVEVAQLNAQERKFSEQEISLKLKSQEQEMENKRAYQQFDMQRIELQLQYEEALQKEIEAVQLKRKILNDKIIQKKKSMEEALKARKVIEKLKEKHYAKMAIMTESKAVN